MNARRSVMVVVAAIAIVVFSPATSVACRIDNDTPRDQPFGSQVEIWFDCGIACGNYWDFVDPGASVSRPGKAGRVQAGTAGGDVCETGKRVSVGAHGQVGVKYNGPKKDPNDSAGGYFYGTDTFTWVSKGGNDWTSPITNKSKQVPPTDGGSTLCWSGTP